MRRQCEFKSELDIYKFLKNLEDCKFNITEKVIEQLDVHRWQLTVEIVCEEQQKHACELMREKAKDIV